MSTADRLEQAEHQSALADAVRQLYELPGDTAVSLINHSENLTYRLDEPSGPKSVLRVHRLGYQSHSNILSEIMWMDALRRDADIETPHAMAGPDGQLVQEIQVLGARKRWCVRFQWIEGETPEETDQFEELIEPFGQLGEVTARLHQHARKWTPPDNFVRQRWDDQGTIGKNPIWGRFIEGPALSSGDKQLLNDCADAVRMRLRRFGQAPDRFGLIHADMRLANLMFHEGNIQVIDFDDCGSGWFLYDLGTALSFMEDRPDVPELVAAWVRGYRKVLALSEEEEDVIPTFIVLRRLTLLGWAASRGKTGGLAQELGEPFSRGTCMLAKQYLQEVAS